MHNMLSSDANWIREPRTTTADPMTTHTGKPPQMPTKTIGPVTLEILPDGRYLIHFYGDSDDGHNLDLDGFEKTLARIIRP